MTGVRKVSAPNNKLPDDLGLNELFRFIKASLAGGNNRKRVIYTDKEYHFTVQTQLHNGGIERQVVRIAPGEPLYFFRHAHVPDRSDESNANEFMVNEGGHAWRVNGGNGTVRYFENPIHVTGSVTREVFHTKAKGLGSSRR